MKLQFSGIHTTCGLVTSCGALNANETFSTIGIKITKHNPTKINVLKKAAINDESVCYVNYEVDDDIFEDESVLDIVAKHDWITDITLETQDYHKVRIIKR